MSSGCRRGRDVDRLGAGVDQRDHHRLVDVAGDDHLVAGPQRGEQEGVVAGGGAVDQIEGAVGAPGVGGEPLRLAEGVRREVDVVDAAADGDVGEQRLLAVELDDLRVHADAQLVPRRGEGRHAHRPVAGDALDEGNAGLVERAGEAGTVRSRPGRPGLRPRGSIPSPCRYPSSLDRRAGHRAPVRLSLSRANR